MDSMNNLSFRISTGLKNIIGRDLISDKFIAVFELVKNSYDAGAHSVVITFQDLNGTNPQIIISDDGCGMSYDDILGKWLFVAYSAKKEKNNVSFRNSIKRNLAGAKGVGRFSCDRLGSKLTLTTKTDSDFDANNDDYMLSIADRLDILEVILPILISEYNMPSTDELIHFKDYYINKVNMYRNRLGHVKLGEQVLHIQGKDVPIDQALHRMLRKNISEVERTLLSIEKYVVSQM